MSRNNARRIGVDHRLHLHLPSLTLVNKQAVHFFFSFVGALGANTVSFCLVSSSYFSSYMCQDYVVKEISKSCCIFFRLLPSGTKPKIHFFSIMIQKPADHGCR